MKLAICDKTETTKRNLKTMKKKTFEEGKLISNQM